MLAAASAVVAAWSSAPAHAAPGIEGERCTSGAPPGTRPATRRPAGAARCCSPAAARHGRRRQSARLAADDRGPRPHLLRSPATHRDRRPRTRALACRERPPLAAATGHTGARAGRAPDRIGLSNPHRSPRVPPLRCASTGSTSRARAGSRRQHHLAVAAHHPGRPAPSTPRCTTSTSSTTRRAWSTPCTRRAAMSSATWTSAPTSPGARTATAFPKSLGRGKELPDWPGEHWLDIRRLRRPRADHRAPARPLSSRRASTPSSPTTSTPTPTTAAFALTADRPTALQPLRRPRRACARALGRPQERPRPGRDARARLRLGAQRAVLPVPRVRPPAAVRPGAGRRSSSPSTSSTPAPSVRRRKRRGLMAMRKQYELDASRQTCW